MEIDEKFEVALGLLEGYHGNTSGFEKALGYLLVKADGNNAEMIKGTWPNRWNKFLAMGKELHKETGSIPIWKLVKG